MKKLITPLICVSLISCSSLNSPCQDQGNGHCASVTTAYQNSLEDTSTPSDFPAGTNANGYCVGSTCNSVNGGGTSKSSDLVALYNQQNMYSQQPVLGSAIRTQPKEMRVWILPYEDDVGLYHDQQYVYAVVKKGNWKYKSMSLSNPKKQFVNTAQVGDNAIDYKPFSVNSSNENSNSGSSANMVLPFQPVGQPTNGQSGSNSSKNGLIGMPNPLSTSSIQATNQNALNSVNMPTSNNQ